jgi:cysteine desulfurase
VIYLMKNIYLDYASSTPIATEVVKVMESHWSDTFGNPGSTHWFGQQASGAVFKARQTIASFLDVDYKDILFTSSATEANNLALRGVLKKSKQKNPRIVVSAIEHESILETCRDLEKEGVEVVYIPVNKEGIVDCKEVERALNKRTILVSIMYANNEIGTIQPVKKIGELIKKYKGEDNYPLFHTDAVQAFQYLPCSIKKLGVDLLTLSAHKIYGPKGIGLLCVKDKGLLAPIITGGGQESGLRSGTENVPYIIGLAKAMELVEKNRNKELKRVGELRDYFWKEMKDIISDIEMNGSLKNRLPNNINIYFPGRPASDLCIELDIWGLAVSSGTACSARSIKPSYVIEALGGSEDRAFSSLRISLGRYTTKAEIVSALKIFKQRFGK